MRDEHLIYTDLPDGKLKILPEAGYRLLCTLTKAYLSEAIVKPKEIKWFVSEVENEGGAADGYIVDEHGNVIKA